MPKPTKWEKNYTRKMHVYKQRRSTQRPKHSTDIFISKVTKELTDNSIFI